MQVFIQWEKNPNNLKASKAESKNGEDGTELKYTLALAYQALPSSFWAICNLFTQKA